MTVETWAAGSVVERAFTYRGRDRYAHLGLRVEPLDGAFGLTLLDAVCEDPDWPVYRLGVIDGLRLAASAAGLYWASVSITALRIHPIDSRRSAFAMAASRCLSAIVAEVARVPRAIPAGALPRVTGVLREAKGAWRGVSLAVEPMSPCVDAPIDWTARWGDIDDDARAWMAGIVTELRESPAPWVDAQIHTADALRRGHGHTRDALRDAVRAALDAAEPAERGVVLPPVTLREG